MAWTVIFFALSRAAVGLGHLMRLKRDFGHGIRQLALSLHVDRIGDRLISAAL